MMRRVAEIEHVEGPGIVAFVCEDPETGNTTLLLEGGVVLAVTRPGLRAFMEAHRLRFKQESS